LALAAPYLFPLVFGERFRSALVVTEILILANAVLAVNVMAVHALRGLGRPLKATKGDVVGMAVTVAGLIYALPRWGIVGAGVVSLISYSTMTTLTVRALHEAISQRS
jgi:O-antigen/teichoic acid export membrane protein